MNNAFLIIAYFLTFFAVYYVAYKHGETSGYEDGLLIGKKSASITVVKQ